MTQPTKGMMEYINQKAPECGDDVWGEDSFTNRFQEKICQLTGKEAALFVPSGSILISKIKNLNKIKIKNKKINKKI